MKYFIHEKAIVETNKIGKGTRIWAFAHILPGAVIGDDCNICDHVFIENKVTIGDRATIKCGVQVWDGVTISDDVFVGPNVTFTNNPFPRSRQWLKNDFKTMVSKGASIGANATILPGTTIGRNAMVGAGSVVTSDVPANSIVVGNPARVTGYVGNSNKERLGRVGLLKDKRFALVKRLSVRKARIYEIPQVEDSRGLLTYGEYPNQIPFLPRRFFVISNVPNREVRGEHAHKELQQFLVCVRGNCSVMLDDGRNRDEILLNTPRLGLYIPAFTWATIYKYSEDAVLFVLASDKYESKDYIRDYNEFIKKAKNV